MTHGVRLLIVDDNAESRRLVRALCGPLAREVSEASDGEAAILACAEEGPDCVVMDVRMRPMNGLAATREILRRWPNICVVIMTNHPDDETRQAASEAGARAFLSKERLVDLPELLSKHSKESSL